MSAADAKNGAGSAAARRTRFGLTTALLLAAATASCILAVIIGDMASARFDVTATRQHALSPRTTQLLDQLESPHEIVVVADFAGLDARARQRIDDVLTEFDRESEMIRYSSIDSVSPSDRERYSGLLDRLASLQAEELERHVEAISGAARTARELTEPLDAMSDRLLAVQRATPPERSQVRSRLEEWAAVARTMGNRLSEAADEADAALEERIAGSAAPPVDAARGATLGHLGSIAEQFDGLQQRLGALRQALGGDAAFNDAVDAALELGEEIRARSAQAADRLKRLESLDVISVARIIEAGPAAVVVSPRGATAVRFESLFPSTARIEQSGAGSADLRFVGEELIATAIASLHDPNQPIVALVHAQPAALLGPRGAPAGEDVDLLFGSLLSRLRLRGMDVTEWAAALDEQPPTLSTLNPDGERPVVWVTLGAAVSTAEGAERMGQLSAAVATLLEDGENVLVSVEPSTLPRVGEPDPMVTPLESFGVEVDSGRPLLRTQSTPAGRVVVPGHALTPEGGAHPAAQAIEGLRMYMPWPMPIELTEREGATTWPLARLEDSDEVWAESQWLEFRSLPAVQRARMANPPAPDEGRDDVEGPWTLAAAAERRTAEEESPQRLVVVASNGWFFDEFTQRRASMEGRSVTLYPGNAELFEASVYWLAEMDHMIAPSPRIREISRIEALTAGQLRALQWSLLGGAPIVILLLGVAFRLVRG